MTRLLIKKNLYFQELSFVGSLISELKDGIQHWVSAFVPVVMREACFELMFLNTIFTQYM